MWVKKAPAFYDNYKSLLNDILFWYTDVYVYKYNFLM